MKHSSFLSALPIFLLGTMLPLSAAVLVTNPNNAPVENVVLQQIPSGEGPETITIPFSWNNDLEIGQSFYTTSALSVTDITFAFALSSAPLKPFTLSIYGADSAAAAPSAENLIFTDSGILPSTLVSNTYLALTLAAPVFLDQGKYYTFMLISSTPDSWVQFLLPPTDSVVDNSFTWYRDEGGYGRYETRSLTVYVQGVVIPEPSSVALLLSTIGIFAALRMRKVSMKEVS